MTDIVEEALANAEEMERAGDGDSIDPDAFAPLRVAVVGVGGRGRARLAAFGDADERDDGDRFDDRRLRLGTAPVDAEGIGAIRTYPGGTRRLDLADVDVLFTTGHVSSPADRDRLRDVAGHAGEDAVTVAVPTVASGVEADPFANLAPAYDATVPLAAARVDDARGGPHRDDTGPADRDQLDHVAGTCCVALVETLFVEPLRALTPHVAVLPLLRDGGPTAAYLGTAPADASPEACARAALDGALAPREPGAADAIVTHVTAGSDVTVADAEALRDAVEREAPDDPGGDGSHYLGVKPVDEGEPVRTIVFLVGCS